MQRPCGATSVCSPPAAYKLIWSDTGVMSVPRKERGSGGGGGKVSMSSASADNPPRPHRNHTPLIHNYSMPSLSTPHAKSKKTIHLQYKFFVRWIWPLIAVAFDGFPVCGELTMWERSKSSTGQQSKLRFCVSTRGLGGVSVQSQRIHRCH